MRSASLDHWNPARLWRSLLWFVPLALLGAAAVAMLPNQLISWSAVAAGIGGLVALASIAILLIRTLRASEFRPAVARLMLVLWFILLVSQHLFTRRGLPEQVLQGSFGASAYLEVGSWFVLLLPVLVILLAYPQAISYDLLFENRWSLLFVVFAVVSAAYAPLPKFSLVWALKLGVAVLMLQIWLAAAHSRADVVRFWTVTFWAAAALVILPLVSLLSHPSTPFGWAGFSGDMEPEFRLNTNIHPVDLTQVAGLLLVMAVAMYCSERRRSYAAWASFAAVVMILGGGKAAIISGVFCCVLLFVLLKKTKKAISVLLLLAGVAAVLLTVTPLGEYAADYRNAETASTLTGRTDLWQQALPLIAEAPLLGHGFIASKFIGEEAETGWDAGHLHNAYLEVLYNNGAIGLILILLIQLAIFRNLLRAVKTSAGAAKVMAAGAFAIFIFLLLNAIVEPMFGGRPSWSFLLFLALLPFSRKLRQLAPAVEHASRQQARALALRHWPATST